jgi:hypothetical protein
MQDLLDLEVMMKRGGCGIVPDDRLLAEKHLLELLQHRLLPLGDPDEIRSRLRNRARARRTV